MHYAARQTKQQPTDTDENNQGDQLIGVTPFCEVTANHRYADDGDGEPGQVPIS